MVIINTTYQVPRSQLNLDFKYLLEIPRSDCLFCSARERASGKSRLYLVFNHNGKIYSRRGLSETWAEVNGSDERTQIREQVTGALQNRTVPYFKSNQAAVTV